MASRSSHHEQLAGQYLVMITERREISYSYGHSDSGTDATNRFVCLKVHCTGDRHQAADQQE
jgi:hypothetical protein